MDKNCLLKAVLALLSLCLISCQDKETASDDAVKIAYRPTFEAAVEPVMDADTKVYVDENLKILWHADDRVGIFDHYTYNQQYAFQGETGANAGTFSIVANGDVVVGNALPAVYAVYPYDAGTAISNDCELSLSLPAIQSYSDRSFGPNTNTMVSVTDDTRLLFKNVGGYLEIKLYGEDVTVSKIVLKGNNDEKIAGKAMVTAPLGEVPTVMMADEATTEITLECATPVVLGATTEDYTEFWFVLPPTEFTQGFTIAVYDDKGGHFEQSTENPVSITRNHLSRMSPVAVEMTTSVNISPNKYLTFTSEETTTLSLDNKGGNAPVLYYSTDKTKWMLWDYSGLTFTREAPLYICGDNPEGFSFSSEKNSKFSASGFGGFSVSGDIMSLINYEDNIEVVPSNYCFYNLFNSTWIIKAPDLPATTLTDNCYAGMFSGCPKLVSAPALPATSLKKNCYASMFSDCSKLITAPVLPARLLGEQSYYRMFFRCSSLTAAPELPSTSLAWGCYMRMFHGCSSLVEAPELPSRTLAYYCYQEMFRGCTSLVNAPELPATTLEIGCYQGMFNECTSLNYVKCLAIDISAEECLDSWLSGVSTSGTFVKSLGMNDWPSGVSGIPEGWTVQDGFSPNKYLTFASEGTTTISLKNTTYSPVLYYSKDGINWAQWDYSELSFSNSAPLYLCGYNMNYEIHGSSFEASGSLFGVSGDIMALYDYVDGSESRYREAYFPGLFKGCTNLVSAPDLPNIMPGLEGYSGMFEGCTNLRVAPALPAKTVTPYCYMRMFAGCTSLTMAPELPATSLDLFCYVSMFRDCTSLVNAPELPATSLADYCYAGMFAGCTRLKEVPELPATQLSLICYSSMFSGCSSLVNAPKIPATSLENGCYSSMFRDCTSLVNAPELPATTLAGGCYESMFSGCTSLIDAPELPATTLAEYCYRDMFRECFNLKKVKCLATDISASQCLNLWLELAAETGTFIKSPNMNDWPTGSSGIPDGWIVENDGEGAFSPNKWLAFTSEGTTMISLVNEGSNAPVLYYSFDKTHWMRWGYSGLEITKDTPLYICGENPEGFSSSSKYSYFTASGDSFGVTGDVMALINCEEDVTAIPCALCFKSLFAQTSIRKAPDLTATSLKGQCYLEMFSGCSGLVEAPELPATTLASYCYKGMFKGCTSLISAPVLPAISLAESCYYMMFQGCESLVNAPELPATTLAPSCYANMFDLCTSLVNVPNLPAMTLAGSCYENMFRGCTSIEDAPELPATTLASSCYARMFSGCTNLKKAPVLSASVLLKNCYRGLFWGCESLNYVKCLATEIGSEDWLGNWLTSVSETGTFIKSPYMNDWPSGSSGIPEGWAVVNEGEVPNGGNEGTTEEEWN